MQNDEDQKDLQLSGAEASETEVEETSEDNVSSPDAEKEVERPAVIFWGVDPSELYFF